MTTELIRAIGDYIVTPLSVAGIVWAIAWAMRG